MNTACLAAFMILLTATIPLCLMFLYLMAQLHHVHACATLQTSAGHPLPRGCPRVHHACDVPNLHAMGGRRAFEAGQRRRKKKGWKRKSQKGRRQNRDMDRGRGHSHNHIRAWATQEFPV